MMNQGPVPCAFFELPHLDLNRVWAWSDSDQQFTYILTYMNACIHACMYICPHPYITGVRVPYYC